MSKASNFVMFVIGAGLGSVATWAYVKNKYEQIAQEEIESVKEVFLKKEQKNQQKEPQTPPKPVVKQDDSLYRAVVKKNNYANYSDVDSSGETANEDKQKKIDKPYVISPDEFGEFEDYEKVSLTYYTDEILADENDDLVEDVDDIVGLDSLNHFGEYEDDSVFVRNDRVKCDYEILLDHRNYSEVLKMRPHQREE